MEKYKVRSIKGPVDWMKLRVGGGSIRIAVGDTVTMSDEQAKAAGAAGADLVRQKAPREDK